MAETGERTMLATRTNERYATRDEVKTIVKVFTDLTGKRKHDPLRRFAFPTNLNTVCTVEFDGPVTIEDFDALLAHVAFYKTFFKKGVMSNEGYLSRQEMVAAVFEALEKLRPPYTEGEER